RRHTRCLSDWSSDCALPIFVSVNPTGLAARSYSGAITFFGVGACNTTQIIPVTLVVTAAPALTLGPSALAFASQAGGSPPAPQKIGRASCRERASRSRGGES